MTDDLLRIASEMEAGDSFDDSHGTNSQEVIKRRAWAARIRACVSPEQVAFVACAKAWGEVYTFKESPDEHSRQVARRGHASKYLIAAYRAMLAAQEKGK